MLDILDMLEEREYCHWSDIFSSFFLQNLEHRTKKNGHKQVQNQVFNEHHGPLTHAI